MNKKATGSRNNPDGESRRKHVMKFIQHFFTFKELQYSAIALGQKQANCTHARRVRNLQPYRDLVWRMNRCTDRELHLLTMLRLRLGHKVVELLEKTY